MNKHERAKKRKIPAQPRANRFRGLRGHDSLGDFLIIPPTAIKRYQAAPNVCGICGQEKVTIIRYLDKPNVTSYVKKAHSLLIRKDGHFIRTLGINCGCYAKCHRQIAHIGAGKR